MMTTGRGSRLLALRESCLQEVMAGVDVQPRGLAADLQSKTKRKPL